jgi:6-phosphofructokinase 1
LNAVIRACVFRAEHYGSEVLGIRDGTMGLLERPLRYETLHRAGLDAAMMRLGGTILGTTNKGNPFFYPMPDGSTRNRAADIAEGVKMLQLDAVIGIGGDGSFSILRRLASEGGFNLVTIPKTIDNDLGVTEHSIGFDTAVSVATEALDRLQPTAASHARIMILEVMGRDAGHIALNAGIAGGADVILLPEIPYEIARVADHITAIRRNGRNYAMVVVSEAVRTLDGRAMRIRHHGGAHRFGGIGHYLADVLAEMTGAETRVTVLGHVQRGSPPTATDRTIASVFGVHAVDLIHQGKFDRMVAWSNREVIDVPILQAINNYRSVDIDGMMVRTARALGICLGG